MSQNYVLFDEAGKFLTGRLMSEADSSVQVELESGKRSKVKSANVLLRFAKPSPHELLPQAQALSQDIDLDLIWEVAPDEDFGFESLSTEYFGASASTVQHTAMLLTLFEAPHYFHRRGKGRFRKAPEDILKAALAGIEKKKLIAAQIATWADALVQGECPEPIRDQLYRILFRPDKNAPEYKAVVEAAKRSQKAPLDLLTQAGAIDSAYEFHWRRFLFDFFPKGTGFPALQAPDIRDDLPLAPVQAFSIDDSSTTEIDDALSVQGLGTGEVIFGIHIAAPALAIMPGSPVDQVARQRFSTVYMPGYKITMLPDEVVQSYTLAEGRDCPAISLYVTMDEQTLAIRSTRTLLERVPIKANLRHDQLDKVITKESLTGQAVAEYPWAAELAFAFRLAQHLKAQREVVRGKPENFNRPDYNFKLKGNGPNNDEEPTGQEQVFITERQRGSPLDLIVAEAMILANSTWGGWLAQFGVPGIYRSQASLAPGIKVRMSTKPLPHAGMGVAQYTWATSPLRRYVDLVNQWQIVACVKNGPTAGLVAPFKPKDAELFSIISGFDGAYSAYNQFQNGLERFWTLRYLQQNEIHELEATVMKDGLVRCDSLPLVVKALGAEPLPRGAQVRIRITGMDLLTLDAHASVTARLDTDSDAASNQEDDADDTEDVAPMSLNLAIDVQDDSSENETKSTDNATTPSPVG